MVKFTNILLVCTTVLISGCCMTVQDEKIMPECDFSIIGEAYQWEGYTLHNGRIFAVDGKKFTLPFEVNEMHCNAYRADLNSDSRQDYLLVVFGTGSGKHFGMMDLYFFISCNKEYSLSPLVSYGGEVVKKHGKWLIRTVDRNGKQTFYNASLNGTLNEVISKVF